MTNNDKKLRALYDKARAAMRDPKRVTDKHGHPISFENANPADLTRDGKYCCKLCIRLYAENAKAGKGTKPAAATPAPAAQPTPGPTAVPPAYAAAVNDPDTMAKECYNMVASRYRLLKGRARSGWIEKLVGMILAGIGETKATKVSPVALPEGLKLLRKAA